MKKLLKVSGIGCGGLIGLIIVLAIVGALLGDSSDKAVSQSAPVTTMTTATGAPTKTPIPARIATFTRTPVSTKTPISTKTPAPTETPVPTNTPAFLESDLAYAAKVIQQTQDLSASFERFSKLMTAPRLGASDWQFQIVAELALWQAVYRETQGLKPSALLRPAHEEYVAGLKGYNDAATDVAYGIDHLDAQRLGTAVSKMEESNYHITKAGIMLQALGPAAR